MALGTITSCHLPLHQCSHSGRDSKGEAALVRGRAYHHGKEWELGCQAIHIWPGIITVIMVKIAIVANIY